MKVTADPYRKALLFALGERHNPDTGICFPDQEMLARDAGMTDRSVRKYVKILEAEGFITRATRTVGGRARIYYILHFERLEALAVDSPAESCSGGENTPTGTPVPAATGTPVPVATGTCVPVHIEEHEDHTKRNTNTGSGLKPDKRSKSTSKKKSRQPIDETETLEAFERLWQLWPRKGRERSRSKAYVLDQLRRASKLKPVGQIVEAARAFVAKTEAQFVPALDRWLKQERFEHFLPKDIAATPRDASSANAQPDHGIDWAAAVARYARSGWWSGKLGDRPDDIGYRGPLEPLETLMATGKFTLLNVENIKINIDRLRAARTA